MSPAQEVSQLLETPWHWNRNKHEKSRRYESMLVLSRKPGDRILINNEIEITVTRIQQGRVRIGIAAPRHFDIRRAELPQWDEAIVDVEQDANQWPAPK